MRNFIFILSFLLFLNFAGYAQDRYVTVISVKANLRGTPSTTGDVVDEVRKDETFKLLEERGSWYLVQTPSYVGWLHGSTIRFSSQPSAFRQRASQASRPVSPDNPSLRIPDPDSIAPEWIDTENDQGYDIAVNNYDGVFLRGESPDTVSLGEPLPTPIKRLKRGDRFVILSRTKTKNWINVIDLESGNEGWVYVSHVKIYYTRNPKSSVPEFQERRTASNRSPEITIKNDTDRTLSLRVGDQRYTIESYSSRTISLTAGTYKFYASAPRVYPLMGEKYWSNGSVYSWTFYIE
jgi:SH3-like domain-containing protein